MPPTHKRYLIGDRSGPLLRPAAEQGIDSFIGQQRGVRDIRRTSVGRRVVHMSEEQMQALAQQCVEVAIEEDVPLQLYGMPGLPFLRAPSDRSYALAVNVRDQVDGRPLPNVTLFGVAQSGLAYEALTNEDGEAVLRTSESPLTLLIASPPDIHWSQFATQIDLEATKTLEIKLKRLLATGAYDWGHRLMGFRAVNQRFSGDGIKVGMIDSGVSNGASDVTPEDGFATLEGQDSQTWNIDEKGHGTHTGGIIGARNTAVGIVGGAPNAKIYPVKVFPRGYVSDLVEGIEWCIRNRMDVVNISVGISQPSEVLAGVICDAYARGISCVVAAGNDAGSVAYPAALPTTIAVGAIGRFGSFPEDSAHALKVSSVFDWYGGLFAANFSNFGPRVDVCAPGVAILSTVPTGYAAWDGTSMASAMVTALVALILEAYPAIRTGDAQQVELVRQILHGAAVDLGMPPGIQGRGLPMATLALSAAVPAGDWSLAQQEAVAGGT
jgi:subtilisin family serine protease